MKTIRTRLAALALAASTCALVPVADGAVPHQDAVPAYSAEQTMLQIEADVPEPGWLSAASGKRHMERHFISSSIDEPMVILQRGGNTWRTLRNGPIAFWSGVLLLLVPASIALFYFAVGPMRLKSAPTGRDLPRFSRWERYLHRVNSVVFVLLAISGLLITFGKRLLIPLIGHDAFGGLAYAGKYLHNVGGPIFVVLSVLMFFTFLRDNFWKKYDLNWIKGMGGFVGGRHIATGKFNAGEKLWFWGGVTLLGLLVSASGLLMDFVVFGQTRYVLQLANYVHLGAAVLYMAAAVGHIYAGTLGVEGAGRAMREGVVDEAWAREHHEYWYEDMKRAAGEPAEPPRGVPVRGARPQGTH